MDRISELEKQLEQEREKVKGLEDKLRAMYANHPEASCYGAMPKLRAQLTQLQALVRAMSKDFHLEDMRKAEAEAQKWEAEGDMYGWNFHQGRASGIREEQSIVYRIMREHGVDPMKALDATTPAVCPDCDGDGVVDSGGTDPNGNPLMRRCGCREKGGDGE